MLVHIFFGKAFASLSLDEKGQIEKLGMHMNYDDTRDAGKILAESDGAWTEVYVLFSDINL